MVVQKTLLFLCGIGLFLSPVHSYAYEINNFQNELEKISNDHPDIGFELLRNTILVNINCIQQNLFVKAKSGLIEGIGVSISLDEATTTIARQCRELLLKNNTWEGVELSSEILIASDIMMKNYALHVLNKAADTEPVALPK